MNQRLVCRNPECRHVNIERTVSYPQIGVQLYLCGPVRCACGTAAEVLPDDARP